MAAIDTAEYQETFNAFLAGDVVDSPAPELIDVLSPHLVQGLKRLKVLRPYDVGTNYHQTPSGEILTLPSYPKIGGLLCEEVEATFGSVVKANNRTIDFRFGMFSRFHNRLREDNGVNTPHLDSTEDAHEFDPVFTSLLVIGMPTLAYVGKIRKLRSNTTQVTFVEGEQIQLREGGIYRATPMTAHWEPTAPLLPRPRYFWRHFHSSS